VSFIGVRRLHHHTFTFPTGQEQRVRDFYGGLLGFDEIPKPPTMRPVGVWFRSNAVELHFIPDDNFVPNRLGHPAIIVEDLDALTAHLTSHQIRVEPDARLPGYRRFHTYDHCGNQIEFLQESEEAL